MRTPTSAPALRLRAYAKINRGLRVLRRRPDGYHEIDTVMQSVDLYDTLTLQPRGDEEISLTMSPDGGIPPEENLALRAARLLRERVGLPRGVHIVLEKRIPVGAGLGGGSSDAAAVLQGLNALFELGLERRALRDLASELGSDVPFFLVGGRCRARGRGERLQPLSVPEAERRQIYVLLVPPFSLRAQEVYQAWDRGIPRAPASPYPNDLEGAALALRPELAVYREFLVEAGSPFGLSGSGPAYFAVAPEEEAVRLAEGAKRELPRGTQVFLCRGTAVGAEIVA